MCSTDRLKNGLKPICITSCVGRALDFGTEEYITEKYGNTATRLNPEDFPYAYINNTNDTGPNLYIKRMPKIGETIGSAQGMRIWKSPAYTGKS
jgi:anaerobic dimethyl sulfoxide reductase subunit B (iron-sulfur subunit)